MFKKKHSKPQERIDSLIGSAAKITGDLAFSGGLRVDGEIHGNVTAKPGEPSTLVLSEHGRIEGDISVTHLVVNGMVNGTVRAEEYMELQSKARVTGDVHYKTLELQLGAIADGRFIYQTESASDKVVTFKISSVEAKST